MCRTVGGAAARPEDKCNKLHILAHSGSPVFCTTECPFLFYWTLVLHQHFSSERDLLLTGKSPETFKKTENEIVQPTHEIMKVSLT